MNPRTPFSRWILRSTVAVTVIGVVAGFPSVVGLTSLTTARPGANGIYVLDSPAGTFRDANIRAHDFVAGYAWRMRWAELERAKDQYDFAAIDHIIARLEPLGQKLSYGMWSPFGWPEYLNRRPAVVTWTYRHFNRLFEMPVPWDPFIQERFRAFVKALGDHRVNGVAFRDHPTLTHVVMMVPGLGFGPIRRQPGLEITSLPGYTRPAFVNTVVGAVRAVVDNFPRSVVLVPLFFIMDETASPHLWQAVRDALTTEFGARIGFWQDSLSAASRGPGRSGGQPRAVGPLAGLAGRHPVGFQMLQSWLKPSWNPNATAGTIPTDAIRHAVEEFGATYFEVYVADLDNAAWQPWFREWHHRLAR